MYERIYKMFCTIIFLIKFVLRKKNLCNFLMFLSTENLENELLFFELLAI